MTAEQQGHTPGEWLMEPGDTVICIRATAEHESYRIADVGGMPYWKKFTETDKANARLIAAAPDLLAACRATRKAFEALFAISPLSAGGKTINHTDLNEAGRLADIAIAKAEGRSS
jgi:hypothetical protein